MRAAGRCLIAGLLGAAIAQQAAAADLQPPTPTSNPAPAAQRPRVGLVLSGGGARRGAHIGVLKVLEALHVPVDVIVGTSAGAIVGSAYASGLPLAEIEHEMAALNTAVLFRDTDRAEVPLRRKADDATNFIGPEFGLGPHGLIVARRLDADVVIAVNIGTPLLRRDQIYARGDFEAVNYTLVDEACSGHVLLAEVSEKSWGPNYLRLGLGLSSDFEGNSFFNLYASLPVVLTGPG
jgi:hypothetical protein